MNSHLQRTRMNTVKRFVASAACVLATAFVAIAGETSIINRNGQEGLFYLQSAKTLGMGKLAVNGCGSFSADPKYLVSFDKDSLYNPNLSLYTAMPSLGYGLTDFLDFAVMLPMYWDHVLENHADSLKSVDFGGLRGGFGDIEVSGKFQYPPYPHKQVFEMALYGALTLPTGAEKGPFFPKHTYYLKNRSNDSVLADTLIGFYTSKAPELDMKMLWTLDLNKLNNISPLLLHVNFGIHFVTQAQLDNLFLLNLAFEYRPVDFMVLFTEFSGETRVANVKNGFKLGDDPLRLSPGVNFHTKGGFSITLGMDVSLVSDTSYLKYVYDRHVITTKIDPRWRLTGSIGWNGFLIAQDIDHDGIKDNVDRCPKDPEDIDGFQDDDGCPDFDNDNDGIADSVDKCPTKVEDRDGYQDADGCPDYDNDKDGIPDSLDKCPNEPEDLDGFVDNDGCPDFDNDNDGVPDSVDKCISIPEDRDGFDDADGCPDLDNDADGILDSLDKCPNEKGVAAYNGCPPPPEPAKVVPPEPAKPKAKEIQRGRVVLRGVNFNFGSAILTGDSYSILDQVFESLKEWPEVKIEIRGHTDNVGSAQKNKDLSAARAESVRQYLINKAVDGSRLTSKGFGKDDPIADNKTAEGRALNRRVELHRTD